MKRILIAIICFVATLSDYVSFAGTDKPIIREERKIVIGGIEELWQLEWAKTPTLTCGPEDAEWNTCPCSGFAYGESGDLTLVRKRKGLKDERLHLTPFFTDDESSTSSEAVLAKWKVLEKDYDDAETPNFVSRVRSRPTVPIMNFEDYDHDGSATEFILQVGNLPCGKHISIVVGVSKKNSRLHAISSVKRPNKPLKLQVQQWEALLKSQKPITVVNWPCGDHGSEVEEEFELVAQLGEIFAKRRTYDCNENGRGKLLKKENF